MYCQTWGQFSGTTRQTVLQFSVSNLATFFPVLPAVTGLHVLSQLHVSFIPGKGSAMGSYSSAQLSTDREQWSHMASLSPLRSWPLLTTLEWFRTVCSAEQR